MELIDQGLIISAIGLITAFLAMSLFIGVIIGLQKIFPPKSEVKETHVPIETLTPEQAGTDSQAEEAIVAAIAATLVYARTRSQANLGADLLSGRGLWWSANQLASRQK